MDEDYALALQLQADFLDETPHSTSQSHDKIVPSNHGSEPQSLVDPFWEMTDPNPDVRALFLQFNERFFWGRLAGIEVRWSPRMTLCAGLCCYEGRGGLCSVRLSVPLLKLRPRKDLVETLLHEMIHAYLFVTDNNKDHDGHGPEFHKHMYRINKEAGTNISVYHNFHDEVDSYRQHWWRCDGPCRSRKPYYGYVKRSMNRAPSKNDTWWTEHQRTCGGTYTKVKEPEDYGKKKGKQEKGQEDEKKKEKAKSTVKSMDIRIFGGEGKTLGNVKPGSSENNKIDLGNVIQKPSGQVFKPVSSISKPKPAATVSRPERNSPTLISEKSVSAKTSQNDDVTHLPGARTPDKKGVKKNKPISQGGVGKFDNKKRSFDLPNFSDSDDTDDELLCSVPLDKTLNISVHSNNYNKPVVSQEVESWWVDESDDKISNASNDENSCDVGNEENRNEQVKSGAKSEVDEKKLDAYESVSNDSEMDDVRAMLRKVWGQKQFDSKNTNMKGTGKLKSRNFQSLNSDFLDTSASVKTKEMHSAHKRLSGDTGFDVAQASKRQKSGRGISIYSPNKKSCSDSEKNVHSPKTDKLTSPIDKFFRTLGGTSQSSGETHTNSGTDCNRSTVIKGDNSQNGDKSQVSAAEMSACPVCNKSVLTSSINEHLDLCLTMQAI